MIVSIGKSILESLFDEEYMFRTSLQNHFGNTINNLIEFVALVGFAGHALYTGLFGMGLRLACQTTCTQRWRDSMSHAPVYGAALNPFIKKFWNNN
jgi:hypothetical protein